MDYGTQKPVLVTEWKFDSSRPHQSFKGPAAKAGLLPFCGIVIVITAGLKEHIRANEAAFGLGLTDEQVARLEGLAAIIAEASLSFLGLGLRPPITSWGVLLNEAQNINVVALYPWLMLPVVPVIVVVLAFNFLGDGLRDAADPYR